MRTRRRLVAQETDLGEIWPSFADVTSTIALIFFSLVLLSYVRDLVSSRRLAAYEQQISSSERKLRLLEGDLARTRLEIEAGQARLARSEKDVADQQAVIAASSLELATLRSRLSGIALLRVDVLDRVKRALESELGTVTRQGAPLVRIGDNGNIVINEGLVFDASSYSIKPEGKALLGTLAVALENVLADERVRENIDAMLVQGHTDERGSSAYNFDLSAKRANAVLNYMFEANPRLEQSYGSFFAASAYSKFRPLNPAKTEEAYEQNRRIELSLVLKDSNVRKVIDEYTQSVGAAQPPPGGAAPVPGAPAPGVPAAP
ncbi:MAG TPA: OmpA family protein [Polyangiaceae bacterium]|jgi:chemotaxis protein MotB|nr:OmpA family protein [Polyangiaceae bacterium]